MRSNSSFSLIGGIRAPGPISASYRHNYLLIAYSEKNIHSKGHSPQSAAFPL